MTNCRTALCSNCQAAIESGDETISHGCIGVFKVGAETRRCGCPECRKLQNWMVEFDARKKCIPGLSWDCFISWKIKKIKVKMTGVKAMINHWNEMGRMAKIHVPEQRFYYIRDHLNRPFITVCIARFTAAKKDQVLGVIEEGKELFIRGISICHFKDMPRKASGVRRAMDRVAQVRICSKHIDKALSADLASYLLKDGLSCLPFLDARGKAFFRTNLSGAQFRFGAWNTTLTEFEKFLFEKGKKDGAKTADTNKGSS